MNHWKITWWDGMQLRETTIPQCDVWNVVNFAMGHGVHSHAIIKIERIAYEHCI